MHVRVLCSRVIRLLQEASAIKCAYRKTELVEVGLGHLFPARTVGGIGAPSALLACHDARQSRLYAFPFGQCYLHAICNIEQDGFLRAALARGIQRPTVREFLHSINHEEELVGCARRLAVLVELQQSHAASQLL